MNILYIVYCVERMDEVMPYGQYGLVTFIRKGAVRSYSIRSGEVS